jgi:hypothetical protein
MPAAQNSPLDKEYTQENMGIYLLIPHPFSIVAYAKYQLSESYATRIYTS